MPGATWSRSHETIRMTTRATEAAAGTGFNRAPYRFVTVQSDSRPQHLHGARRRTTPPVSRVGRKTFNYRLSTDSTSRVTCLPSALAAVRAAVMARVRGSPSAIMLPRLSPRRPSAGCGSRAEQQPQRALASRTKTRTSDAKPRLNQRAQHSAPKDAHPETPNARQAEWIRTHTRDYWPRALDGTTLGDTYDPSLDECGEMGAEPYQQQVPALGVRSYQADSPTSSGP